jgi:hypothetical protein
MEQLISYLINHLGIVIFVVGIIYALFFRKSPLERPPNRMPDFGGGGQRRPGQQGRSGTPVSPSSRPAPTETQFPEPQGSVPPSAPPRQQSVRMETRQTEPKTLQQRPVVIVHPGTEEEAITRSLPIQHMRVSSMHSGGVAERQGTAGLTRDDLSRAVIWAEILGPPRARRPHRR